MPTEPYKNKVNDIALKINKQTIGIIWFSAPIIKNPDRKAPPPKNVAATFMLVDLGRRDMN
jgi:hypothetical protein